MAEKETIILDFQVEQGDAISELEKTKKSIIGLKQEQQELNKAYKQGNVTIDEYASESVRLEGILKKQTNQYNTLQKSTAGVVTQFDKLIAANEKIGKEVGKQNEKFKEFAANVNVGGASVSDLSGKLTSFINPATAAAGAVSALAGLYLSSAAGARDLESAQDQLSSSFKTIGNDIASLLGADGSGGGPLSRLANAFNTIVFGAGAGIKGGLAASANQGLKELELLRLEAQGVAKQALSDAEKLRRIRDDQTKSFAERKKAAEDTLGFINVREQVLVNVQKQRLANLLILLSQDKNNLELQKEILQTKFEIRDIEEDSEGKRTEALNGINNLLKEQNALLPKNIELNQNLFATYTGMEKAISDIIANKDGLTGVFIEVGELEDESIASDKAYEQELAKNSKKRNASRNEELEGAIALSAALVALGENGNQAQRTLALTTIGINSAIGISNAVKAGSGLTFPANLVAILSGITAVLTGIGQAKNVLNQAAGGGKFMTKGPTMLLVGDNPGGVERVTVEPISGRGKTRVSPKGNLIAMAGGGVLETQSVTNPINQSFAFRGMMDKIEVVASWKEATELQSRIKFKEALTQI